MHCNAHLYFLSWSVQLRNKVSFLSWDKMCCLDCITPDPAFALIHCTLCTTELPLRWSSAALTVVWGHTAVSIGHDAACGLSGSGCAMMMLMMHLQCRSYQLWWTSSAWLHSVACNILKMSHEYKYQAMLSPIHTWCTKNPMRVMMQSFAWVAELSFSGSICPLHRGEHVRSQSASWWIFSVQGNQLLWAELRSRCNTGVQGGEGITEKPCISSMHLAENADIGVRGGGGHQIMMWCMNLPGWLRLENLEIHSYFAIDLNSQSVTVVGFQGIRHKSIFFYQM